MNIAEDYKSSDKEKWFTDEGYTFFIRCTTDKLIDYLLDIFKGDRQRAIKVNKTLRRVSFEEYVNYSLYKD